MKLAPACILAQVIACNSRVTATTEVPDAVASSSVRVAVPSRLDNLTASASVPTFDSASRDAGAPDAPALTRDCNRFGLDLFAQLGAQNGNVVLAPPAICTSLVMTWAGAKSKTAAEMQKTLRLHMSATDAVTASGHLLANYLAPAGASPVQDGTSPTLRMANYFFSEASYPFDQPFLDLISTTSGASLRRVNFKIDADRARLEINDWVAAQTDDRIRYLLPPRSVDDETHLVLATTFYLRANWAIPFSPALTVSLPFHISASRSGNVPMMQQTERLRFAAADDIKLVELPYAGGRLTMTVVVPDKSDGLRKAETALRSSVERWLAHATFERVEIGLPRIRLDALSSTALSDPLKRLGMRLVFDPQHADLSGMASSPAEHYLYLQEIFHKAYINVNEAGTEAAAGSGAVLAVPLSADTSAPIRFLVDRPFLFILRDKLTGLILFLGRVTNPIAS